MSNSSVLFHFSVKFKLANRIAPDKTPRVAASHLGLLCLPMSHKKRRQAYYMVNIDVAMLYDKLSRIYMFMTTSVTNKCVSKLASVCGV